LVIIDVPSLNNRKEDIPLLINHFTQSLSKEQGIAPKSFSKAALEALQNYDWSGNIRELRNVVERLLILGSPEISNEDVQLFAKK
jgi:two-component system nitrogen regulation response regulator NtrX